MEWREVYGRQRSWSGKWSRQVLIKTIEAWTVAAILACVGCSSVAMHPLVIRKTSYPTMKVTVPGDFEYGIDRGRTHQFVRFWGPRGEVWSILGAAVDASSDRFCDLESFSSIQSFVDSSPHETRLLDYGDIAVDGHAAIRITLSHTLPLWGSSTRTVRRAVYLRAGDHLVLVEGTWDEDAQRGDARRRFDSFVSSMRIAPCDDDLDRSRAWAEGSIILSGDDEDP